MSPRPPSVAVMRNLGLAPDPWQVEVLEAGHPRLLLNCCRQAGKSTVVAVLGLVEALWKPMTKVLLVSRSLRQSKELFRQVCFFHSLLGDKLAERQTASELELTNLSRIVCLPCKEETIRGYAHVDLLIIDEAARVPDDLYRAVRPMLAVSQGRMICLSTPYGKRGFFYDAWSEGGADWARIEIPAAKVPRIAEAFLAQERRALGESWFRQEYCCSFEALEGLVYPDFARCVVPALPPGYELPERAGLRQVGGLDFGFHNPFAALWGVVDHEGVLWLTGEHYARQKHLSHHARCLPRKVTWYADPAGATEIAELRCAGFHVHRGNNALRPGIAAVSARVENGTLKVVQDRCPNLLAEAALYRYDSANKKCAETPLDAHNHALAALRYLISKLDHHRMAGNPNVAAAPTEQRPPARRERTYQEMVEDERLWIPLW